MTSDLRYTLEEARRILCIEYGGHDLEQTVTRMLSGHAIAVVIHCTRCHTRFQEVDG